MKNDHHSWMACSLLFVALFLSPVEANAHLVSTGFGTFYDGLAHLFITPADILITLGLGLLAGLCGGAASRGAVIALPSAWLTGEMVGSAFPAMIELPWLTTLSFGIIGLLVAMNAKLPPRLLLAIAWGAGTLHGFVNGATMAAAGTDRLGMFGATIAVFVVTTLTAALVVSLKAPWSRIAVRVAGSWITAVGLLTIGWLVKTNS